MVRTLPCHGRGREFESRRPRQLFNNLQRSPAIMESVEPDDHFRFGKVRQEWEKEIRNPDDVFLQAEERRKELAKNRKQKGLLKTKTTKKSRL